jgi:hypothetical protein
MLFYEFTYIDFADAQIHLCVSTKLKQQKKAPTFLGSKSHKKVSFANIWLNYFVNFPERAHTKGSDARQALVLCKQGASPLAACSSRHAHSLGSIKPSLLIFPPSKLHTLNAASETTAVSSGCNNTGTGRLLARCIQDGTAKGERPAF